MRRQIWFKAAGAIALLSVFLLGISPAKDGRDFAGFYELREVNDLGEEVSGRFVARVFNYSGSDNYGLDWQEAIYGRYYERELPDIQAGVDTLVARGLADPDRLGVHGWSNGSILAIALVAESDRFAVACCGAGDVNWTSDYGNCAFGVWFDELYIGGAPWKDPSRYVEKCEQGSGPTEEAGR